jgi:hypothetical protein
MTRRDLGVTGQIKLAEMAALPPFAQMLADMDGLGSFAACGGCLCIHGEKPSMRISPIPLRPG